MSLDSLEVQIGIPPPGSWVELVAKRGGHEVLNLSQVEFLQFLAAADLLAVVQGWS